MTHIEYSLEGTVATITMVPETGKPPTLDGTVLSELEDCIEQARQDKPRIVFLRSLSDRFFCVGANLNLLKNTTDRTIVPWVMQGHGVLNKLEDLPMPIVAVVEGYAMGGGLELAMACDLIFASDSAQFAQSEGSLGFIPGWGGTRRLARRIGTSSAKYYFYSGKIIDAGKAAEIGLVDFVSDKNGLEEEIRAFAAGVAANNQNALTQFKIITNDQANKDRYENAAIEAFRSVSCLQDADALQRLNDFLTKKRNK